MPESRTYADRREYLIAAVSKRRKRLKEMVVEYKGGKCSLCGYNRCIGAFDLHHIDGGTKEFGLSTRGLTRSWEKLKAEADKCILVCANCHREIHADIAQIPKKLFKKNRTFSSAIAQSVERLAVRRTQLPRGIWDVTFRDIGGALRG